MSNIVIFHMDEIKSSPIKSQKPLIIQSPIDQKMDNIYVKPIIAKSGDWVRVDGPSCCPDNVICGTICGISSGNELAVEWCCGTYNIIFKNPRCLCGCHCCGYVLATCNCCQCWSNNCWNECCWTSSC